MLPDKTVTPEEGYALAKFETPGVYIVMGLHSATVRQIKPATNLLPRKTWLGYDLGFEPSHWCLLFINSAKLMEYIPTREDYIWLSSSVSSLSDARNWLNQIYNKKVTSL